MRHLTTMLTLLLCTNFAFAQDNSLFKSDVVDVSLFTERLARENEAREVKKSRLVKSSMKSLNDKDRISINIFDSVTYSPMANWSFTNESGYHVWGGTTRNAQSDYSLIIQKDGRMTGQILLNDRMYVIEHVMDDIHILKEMDIKQLNARCATVTELPDSISFDVDTEEEDISKGGGKTKSQGGRVNDLSYNSTPFPVCSGTDNNFLPNLSNNTYRVGFAYTPQYAAIFPNSNALLDEINLYVEEMNYTYANSLIDLRAVLAFAYPTPSSETISFDVNFRNFTHSQDIIYDPTGKYDEFFIYQFSHKADVGILMLAASDDAAGRANVNTKMAIAVRSASLTNLTVAHEVGHILGCEHNREEMEWWELPLYDGKKAYGYLNEEWNWRTVMSYGSVPRLPFYSDLEMDYNGRTRGNYYANAADYIREHNGDVTSNFGIAVVQGFSGNIPGGEIANIYGLNEVQISNSVISPNARVLAHASQSVKLQPGFHAMNGSTFQAYISSHDSPAPPNLLPQSPGQPATVKHVQGDYICRGDAADFCIDGVPNATHYVWSASDTGISVSSSFNGRAVRLSIGPNANWAGTHSISVTANNIYGASTAQTFLFGLNQSQCESEPPPQARIAEKDEATNKETIADIENSLDIYPNPATKSITIRYHLSETSPIAIALFDLTGKNVENIFETDFQTRGQYEFTHQLSILNPGIYIVTYRTKYFNTRKKIIIR